MTHPSQVAAAIATVRAHNAWRRGEAGKEQTTSPQNIGLAIDILCNWAEAQIAEISQTGGGLGK